MNDFKFNCQTAMFFGNNCIEKNAALFKNFGNKAAVFSTAFPKNHINKALMDIIKVFEQLNVQYCLINDVCTDPTVESVEELSRRAREFGAEFFVAVGGGSAIDTAKAAAILMSAPAGENPYNVFWEGHDSLKVLQSELPLPLIAVPTTAGTGAEVTPFAVLTRADIHTKNSISHKAYPTAAFLDSRYIKDSPLPLLHSGIFDALAHGIESYLNKESTPLGRMLAEYGFYLFKTFKDRLIERKHTDEDYDHMMLAAFVQGMACMQSNTTIPHGLGYPLAHRHISHGLACGIFLGEYLLSLRDQDKAGTIVSLCGFEDTRAFAQFCGKIMAEDIELTVTEQDIMQWTEHFMTTQSWRFTANPEPMDRSDIERLYRISLEPFMKS